MKINFLKAANGDSIHLRYKDNEGTYRNILIDGGLEELYKLDKNSKGKAEFGQLKTVINKIIRKGEFIDLLIITHIHDDHIKGILKWFESDNDAHTYIKEVLFNSGRSIAAKFNEKVNKDIDQYIDKNHSVNTTIESGIQFGQYIHEKNIWDYQLIEQGCEFNKIGLNFKILSPDEDKLSKFLKEWKKKNPELDTAYSENNDYSISLRDHIKNDSFKEDGSKPNGSSIAFIITYNGKNLLFLGDSHPSVVLKGLGTFDYSRQNPLHAELVKLSHHGSKKNTTVELLECIKSKNFIISTNGSMHNHPDKQLLARLINKVPDCRIHFNYKERMNMIFTDEDKIDYPDFKVISMTDEFEV